MKFLELRIYRKLFSDLHLPPSLDAPPGWFYSTCFLHWQCVWLLMSIIGLNPLKITSLDSLAALVKMQPKYLIESSSSALSGSAIYDCGVTSASPAASHGARSQPWQTWEVPAAAGAPWWVKPSARTASPSPELLEIWGVANSLASGGRCCFSDQLWTPWQAVGENFFRCCLITAALILKWWGSTGRW